MNELRKSPRKIANEVLEVTDQITGSRMGKVVNISVEGLMLLGHEMIRTGTVYQLDLKLPRLIKNHSTISFGAESVWCQPAAQPESYWTGFRVIDISEEGMLAIDDLIFDWHVLD